VPFPSEKKQGVCVSHNIMAMPFTFKSISRQKKKNYGNSNTYFTMQKYTQSSTKKSSQKKGTKILQDIRTLDN
jgi:hypothetical protein